MSDVVVDEPVFFYQWETDHHVAYDAIVRVIPGDAGHPFHPKLHLTCFFEDAPGGSFNVNNVFNVEVASPVGSEDLDGQDYWKRRYSQWPLP